MTSVLGRPHPASGSSEAGGSGAVAARRAGLPADVGVYLGYIGLSLLVLGSLWANLDGGYLTHSGQDQNMWEWFFAVTAHNVLNWNNPLFSALQNHPAGVNLMANTAMLGLGIPLIPVTVLFGPTVTWALALTGGLAGTAAAWYWVLSRHIVSSRPPAAIGGCFAGFAPPIISHATAHPNFVVLFVFPFIVLLVLKLARGLRPVRNGIVLGLLLSYQAMLGKEALLIGATTFAVFAAAYCVFRRTVVPEMVRPVAVGGGIAVAVFAVLLAYPLWWQFFGPQSYTTLEHGPSGNDLAAFTTFATESLAAEPEAAARLSLNRTEENAFFGWPLLVFLAGVTVWLWREPLVRALATATVVMAWLSAGALMIVGGTVTGIPGPWLLLADEPLYESVLESRFALGCVPLIAVLLALAAERAFGATHRALPRNREWRVTVRVVFCCALAAALVPIAPTPLPVHQRKPVPDFFAEGMWREYVRGGGSVVVAPLPDPGNARALHWQIATGFGFPIAGGYFVGPHGPSGAGGYGPDRTETSELLEEVSETGDAAEIEPIERLQALRDLRYWNAEVVVLAPYAPHRGAVRTTLTRLLGSPSGYAGGVWFWDVHAR